MKPKSSTAESATLRLWTFQHAAIVPALHSAKSYRATWDRTPCNWRLAYEWMAAELDKFANCGVGAPPIWCWHSCHARRGAPPTVNTAMMLLNSYQIEQGMVTIELAVPAKFVLLSSYWDWNCLLDHVIVNQRLPRSHRKRRQMFLEPLLKHEGDDIQAVIPGIKPEWVRGVCDLTIAGRPADGRVIPNGC